MILVYKGICLSPLSHSKPATWFRVWFWRYMYRAYFINVKRSQHSFCSDKYEQFNAIFCITVRERLEDQKNWRPDWMLMNVYYVRTKLVTRYSLKLLTKSSRAWDALHTWYKKLQVSSDWWCESCVLWVSCDPWVSCDSVISGELWPLVSYDLWWAVIYGELWPLCEL